jgi:alkaline phosphatase D
VLSATHPALTSAQETDTSFQSAWSDDVNRTWPGPDYWPNPLQDWRVRAGRLECCSPGGDRNVALLTRIVVDRPGELMLSVRCGQIEQVTLDRGFDRDFGAQA